MIWICDLTVSALRLFTTAAWTWDWTGLDLDWIETDQMLGVPSPAGPFLVLNCSVDF